MALSRKTTGNGGSASLGYPGGNKDDNNAGPFSSSKGRPNDKENMLSLKSLNPYITCPICSGYFVDATTVIDCLHTFCKSCLLKYFQDNTDCPKCHYQIHQSHPSHYVAFDRTMQDIVYKLVPGMQAEEQSRREQFKQRQREKETSRKQKQQQQNGQQQKTTEKSSSPSAVSSNSTSSSNNSMISDENDNNNAVVGTQLQANTAEPAQSNEYPAECCNAYQDPTTTHRRGDEPVLIQLVADTKLESIERSFVRLSAFATVNTVKRLIAYLIFNDVNRYSEFDIFCNRELMGRDFSMTFIRKTRWRNKPEPVILNYREHLDF